MRGFLTGHGRPQWALWPACVGALAVLYASIGDGAWTRRSAIAWMMGSWGARLGVQASYARNLDSERPAVTSYFRLMTLAVFFSLPALIAARNPDPSLTPVEMAASVLWMAAFAVETTADRQLLRFTARSENSGLACRTGVWRVLPNAHAVCEVLIWTALASFAAASPWGWVAFSCPVAMLFIQLRHRAIDAGAPLSSRDR